MTAADPGRPRVDQIARLLGVDPGEVQGLDEVSDADLDRLHTQIADRLFADKRRRFARLAGLAQTIPGPIAGRLAEKFLPPAGAALAAELLEPAKARDLVDRVSVGYLGDLAVVLDPVRAQRVIRAIPPERVGEVATELFARQEYAAMAAFVGSVEIDALFATLRSATPHDLLAVVPLLEWNENLDHVIAELPEEQIHQIATELDGGELADLALALEPRRFGPIVDAVPVDTVAAIAGVLLERGEYVAMAGFAEVITAQMRSAAVTQATGPQLDGLIGQLVDDRMWTELEHLVDGLDGPSLDRLRTAVREMPDAAFTTLRSAALGAASGEVVAAAAEQRASAGSAGNAG